MLSEELQNLPRDVEVKSQENEGAARKDSQNTEGGGDGCDLDGLGTDTGDPRVQIDTKKEKPWKCGKEYLFPLPEPESDPWEELLKSHLKRDAARCQGWKEEVQNIIIFAGLFSAVVTAFIIESYKSLRKDPIEVILTTLIDHLQLTGEALDTPTTDGFSLPLDASTRINTLWFLSLVSSLVTVLIGTISLQWLREHEKYRHADLEPQIAFSLHQMQVESLDKWFVPQAFTLLSLLLQAALVLFLVGLTELLWRMNQTVGAWIATAVGLTFLFLLLTAILPTLQAISLFLPLKVKKPRLPCPYRSPQAWAFHHLASWFVDIARSFNADPSDRYRKIDSHHLTLPKGREEWLDPIPHGTGILFRNRRKDTWLEHSVGWLFQRDFDYMSKVEVGPPISSRRFTKRPVPLYDAVQGLLDEKQTAFASHSNSAAVDYCIGMALSANHNPTKPEERYYAAFLNQMSQTEPLVFGLPQGVETDDLDVLHDDAALRLLSRNNGFDNLPPGTEEWAVEICVRLTRWLYAEEPRPWRQPDSETFTPQSLPIQWVGYLLEKGLLDPEMTKLLQIQVRKIILDFFRRTHGSKCTKDTMDTTMDNNMHVGRFLSSAARILTFDGDHSICDEILELIKGSSGPTSYPPQAALRFCQTIIARREVVMTEPLRRFVVALHGFKRRGLEKPIVAASNFSWKGFIDRAKSLGVELEEDIRDSKIYPSSKYSDVSSSVLLVTSPDD